VEVLIMHDMDGYTREEISRILELPPGTVASRIRSARALFVRAWNSKVTS
jgi:DNA-directed RNA polymerase specialized sigma24 family protein